MVRRSRDSTLLLAGTLELAHHDLRIAIPLTLMSFSFTVRMYIFADGL